MQRGLEKWGKSMGKKEKKEENKFHREYGPFRNLAYIAREMYAYDKLTALTIALSAICTPICAYLWTFMSKFVIDVVTRQDKVEKLIGILTHLLTERQRFIFPTDFQAASSAIK